MEWVVLPCNHKSSAFSARSNSVTIIVDGKGRIGGLLTGGTSQTESTDVSYATPFYWPLAAYPGSLPLRLPLPAHGLGIATLIRKTSATLAKR